jgi:hypothetical protein
MPEPMVREIGRVEDSTDETTLPIGVDYDTVTVGLFKFDAGAAEEFAQAFVRACWAAAANKQRMADDA